MDTIVGVELSERKEHAARRDRSIRLAVVTSFLSKGGTFLLQLLAIPIAVRVMGRAEFGVFTTISLALSIVHLLEIGVGPALAHGISEAGAKGDAARRRALASTAFFLVLGLALVAGAVIAVLLLSVPIPTLFGADYAGSESAMRPALWIGLGLFLLIFVLNLTDRLREGLLEVAKTNTWGAGGNILAAAAVAGGIWVFPEIWYLVVAIHGSVVLAKLGNTVTLWCKHRDLIPSPRFIDRSVVRHLVSDGAAFATCCLLVGVVEYSYCGWLIGRISGPEDVALFGPLMALTTMQLGFVMMLSTPTWPAVTEALAGGDTDWAKSASRKLYLYGSAFALVSAAGVILLGPWGMRIWLGEEFGNVGRPVLAAYAFYFVAHVWRHLNHALMIGTGQVMRLAKVQLIETGIVVIASTLALKTGGMPLMLAVMGFVILTVTGTILPRRVAAVIGRTRDSAAP